MVKARCFKHSGPFLFPCFLSFGVSIFSYVQSIEENLRIFGACFQLCEYSRPSFEFCWLWIFPWIKLSWHSCFMSGKPGWLNRFWEFLCEGLSSFNLKGFLYSYGWSHSLCERRTFCTVVVSRKLCRFLLIF